MEKAASEMSPAHAYHFLTHAVAPRPIAWITTLGPDGVVNAAPFSWFQSVCADPPMVMVAFVDKPGHVLKDTANNILESGEFVINIARGGQLEALVATSVDAPPGDSEIEFAGLDTVDALTVKPPRIAGCGAYLECKLVETHRYGRESATSVVIGEVQHFGADDDLLTPRGVLDAVKAGLPARLGGNDYLRVTEIFQVGRPRKPAPGN